MIGVTSSSSWMGLLRKAHLLNSKGGSRLSLWNVVAWRVLVQGVGHFVTSSIKNTACVQLIVLSVHLGLFALLSLISCHMVPNTVTGERMYGGWFVLDGQTGVSRHSVKHKSCCIRTKEKPQALTGMTTTGGGIQMTYFKQDNRNKKKRIRALDEYPPIYAR